jgi:hypothetical protein
VGRCATIIERRRDAVIRSSFLALRDKGAIVAELSREQLRTREAVRQHLLI